MVLLDLLWVTITIIITFIVGEFLGYAIHRLTHKFVNSGLHRRHMTHHLKFYPRGRLVSVAYLYAKQDSFTVLFLPIILILIATCWLVFPLYLWITVSVSMLLDGLLNDYIHKCVHLQRTWLMRFKWFKTLRTLHFLHHRQMDRNYGIYQLFLDKLFKTYTTTTHRIIDS